jgi:hypothetical protein
MALTTHLDLVPGSRIVELYIYTYIDSSTVFRPFVEPTKLPIKWIPWLF